MARHSTNSLLTIASSVYGQLRHDILHGHIPPGQKLRIESVCGRYGVGNSPVREALNRLSSEGLVDRQEQRGFRVVSTSPQDLAELVDTRCWLEEIALRRSIAQTTAKWHEALVLALHRLTRVPRSSSADSYQENAEWERLHRQFHRTLLSGCGSGRLLRYCEDLADHAYRYRQLSMRKAHLKRNVHVEHNAIVDAVLDGAADHAVELLTSHYRRTAELARGEPLSATFDAAA